jgi:hypothetical protein
MGVAGFSRLSLILLFITHHSCRYFLAIATDHDCILEIHSPSQGSEYLSHQVAHLSASINIHLGEGPISDAVRLNPSEYEICTVWDALDDEVKTADSCRRIVVGGELPNYLQRTTATKLGQHRFRVYLRSREHFFNPYPIAMNETSYKIVEGASNNQAASSSPSTTSSSSSTTSSTRQDSTGTRNSRCRAAVCVSGQWRTFADPNVRSLFRKNLIGGLSGSISGPPTCDIDLFFFAKPTDAVGFCGFV